MKADRTVKRELRRLRRYIDANRGAEDAATIMRVRIAYEIETAIRWAREDGIRGWPAPLELAIGASDILGNELAAAIRREGKRMLK